MSELREKIEGILQAGDMFLEPPEDMAEFIDKGAIKQSRADQILAAFKAYIEGCKPKNPYPYKKGIPTHYYQPHIQWNEGGDEVRKALMESLEEEKG